MYTVKQVATLTGVTEATLRVWERRYAVVRPERSPSGYRLYDDAQLDLLRQMAALVGSGTPASRAALVVSRTPLPAPRPESSERPDAAGDALELAASSLDPARLDAVIAHAFTQGTFEEVAAGWILPQIERLGDAWAQGRLDVVQEHFASAGLMRAIAAEFDRAASDTSGPLVLVGLPENERHEIALFCFATCLRRLGAAVAYLGADLPADGWVRAAVERHPRVAVIGVHSSAAAAHASRITDLLAQLQPAPSVWAGGGHRAEVTSAQTLPESVTEAAASLHRRLLAGVV